MLGLGCGKGQKPGRKASLAGQHQRGAAHCADILFIADYFGDVVVVVVVMGQQDRSDSDEEGKQRADNHDCKQVRAPELL